MSLGSSSCSSPMDSGVMSSNTSPTQAPLEHPPRDSEAGPDIAEEEFRPASEALFSDPSALDFLSTHGGGRLTEAQRLARDSLYVRFDPLVGRPSVIGVKSDTEDGKINTVTEEQEKDLIGMNSPSPKKTHDAPTESEIPSTTNASSLSISSPPKSTPVASTQSAVTPSKSDPSAGQTDGTLGHHHLEFQEQLLHKEAQIAELEKIIEEKLFTIEKLKRDAEARKESEEQMKQVLKEYEKTISKLIADKEREKTQFEQARVQLVAERDQAAEDLKNAESAFADVHRKYERSKQVVEGFKENEEALKQLIEDLKESDNLGKQDQKYELLKAHAEETLERANREIENVARSNDSEVARLTAMLKKTEMKAISLERSVDQKAKENQELTAICDELIAKVGS